MPLMRVISRAYGIPEIQIIGPAWIADERYAITAVPERPVDFQPLLQRELGVRLALQAHKDDRQIEVYVLKRIEGVEVKLAPSADLSDGGGQASQNHFNMTGIPLRIFTSTMETILRRPIFNETQLTGRYDVDLSWTGTELSLKSAIRETLGLQLVDDKRMASMLIIDSIQRLQ